MKVVLDDNLPQACVFLQGCVFVCKYFCESVCMSVFLHCKYFTYMLYASVHIEKHIVYYCILK